MEERERRRGQEQLDEDVQRDNKSQGFAHNQYLGPSTFGDRPIWPIHVWRHVGLRGKIRSRDIRKLDYKVL